jgi:hypothetical protein
VTSAITATASAANVAIPIPSPSAMRARGRRCHTACITPAAARPAAGPCNKLVSIGPSRGLTSNRQIT